jgi:hypothetical protein
LIGDFFFFLFIKSTEGFLSGLFYSYYSANVKRGDLFVLTNEQDTDIKDRAIIFNSNGDYIEGNILRKLLY